MSDCRLNSSSLCVTGWSGSGLLTYTPLPVRISIQPVISRAISASRIDERLTPSCLDKSRSEGIISPGANWPVLIQLISTFEIWRYSLSTFSVGNSMMLSADALFDHVKSSAKNADIGKNVDWITLMILFMLNDMSVRWPDHPTT